MAQKNSDIVPSYMDGISVKIAEKYKPPKRIILPTNTQRLTSNDLASGPNFTYDFSLENSVKSKIKELQQARNVIKLDRAARIKNYQDQNVRDNDTDLKTDIPSTDSVSYPNDISDETTTPMTVTPKLVNSVTAGSGEGTRTTSSVLLPTQMTFSTITNLNNSDVPTPINISDFENDTASPFDNMELKTLNDLAELAQVLQPVQAVSSPNYTTTNMYCNHFNLNSTSNNVKQSGFNNDGCLPKTTYIPINDNRPINGYYTNYLITSTTTTHSVQQIPSLHNQNSNSYEYANESHVNNISLPQNTLEDTNTSTTNKSRSVPDIINSLQKELMQTRIEEANAAMKMQLQSTANNTLSSSLNATKRVSIQTEQNISKLPNPYASLSQRQQQIVKEVALMGFPLDRVARACETIGDDQSRLIEHMIGMSQLLDLGFSEENITKALLECDNDRDKALDYLVA